MKLISVVIPLYNQKKYISQAIDSILSQSYDNIEIIVVNDGSTDNPKSILKKYHGKIKLIEQTNKGLAAARNIGIAESSGSYIQFLDADDFLNDTVFKNIEGNFIFRFCLCRASLVYELNDFY